MFGNMWAQRRHSIFRQWKQRTLDMRLTQELNEKGPVAEELFEARRLLKNLVDFMRSEGIPEERIS